MHKTLRTLWYLDRPFGVQPPAACILNPPQKDARNHQCSCSQGSMYFRIVMGAKTITDPSIETKLRNSFCCLAARAVEQDGLVEGDLEHKFPSKAQATAERGSAKSARHKNSAWRCGPRCTASPGAGCKSSARLSLQRASANRRHIRSDRYCGSCMRPPSSGVTSKKMHDRIMETAAQSIGMPASTSTRPPSELSERGLQKRLLMRTAVLSRRATSETLIAQILYSSCCSCSHCMPSSSFWGTNKLLPLLSS